METITELYFALEDDIRKSGILENEILELNSFVTPARKINFDFIKNNDIEKVRKSNFRKLIYEIKLTNKK
jgi:hypothetical protein